jgi:hypothetical protein
LHFRSFDDYWLPFLSGVGSSGSDVTGLTADHRGAVQDRLVARLMKGRPEKELGLRVRAWAVRGGVPAMEAE